jgi:ABC-type spermidine/putrescine transport system permease subunit II
MFLALSIILFLFKTPLIICINVSLLQTSRSYVLSGNASLQNYGLTISKHHVTEAHKIISLHHDRIFFFYIHDLLHHA